jgi:hypothetical protein
VVDPLRGAGQIRCQILEKSTLTLEKFLNILNGENNMKMVLGPDQVLVEIQGQIWGMFQHHNL